MRKINIKTVKIQSTVQIISLFVFCYGEMDKKMPSLKLILNGHTVIL